MAPTGFEAHSTATLLQVRENLLAVSAQVWAMPEVVRNTPTEGGHKAAPGTVLRSLVLPMLEGVEAVLAQRGAH